MATLTSTKIKNTYDALLKSIDNDAIGTTAKQITDGLGNVTPLYVSTTQVGIGVTPESGLNLHVYGDAKIGSNLTVIGNLVVEGSTTTVGTDTLTVKDPLIVLANNNTSTDAVDIGFYGKYTPSGTTLYSGLFREALTGKYRLFKDLQVEPTTTVNTSGTGYAQATLIAALEGDVTGNITGNVTGNLTGNVTGNVTGDVTGDLTGDVTGDLTGNVTGGSITATTGLFTDNVNIAGTLVIDDELTVEGSAFGRIEIGGPSGGYIDLKAPHSDDYDLRLITSTGGGELLSIDTLKFYTGATTDLAFTIDASQNATFENNVTIPETPTADTHAASKGYVDAAVEGQDTLAEILANGNTSGANDIIMADNQKIYYGTGSDVEMYFDGATQFGIINDTAGGSIFLRSDSFLFRNDTDQFYSLSSTTHTFKSSGTTRLTVNSTGIDVNGNINLGDNNKIILGTGGDIEMFFDGGTFVIDDTSEVQQGIDIDTNRVRFRGTDLYLELGNAQHTFWTTGTQRLQINSSGVNISSDFTVNTDTLFVDYSADSVGIGLTNPADYTADELVISVPDESGMTLVSGTTDAAYISFADATGTDSLINYIRYDHNDDTMSINNFGGSIKFSTGEAVDRMTINSSGITIHDELISSSYATIQSHINIDATVAGDPYISFQQDGTQRASISYDDTEEAFRISTDEFFIKTGGPRAKALTVDSSQNSTFTGQVIASSSSSGDYVRMYGGSGTAQWDIYGNGENLRISENSGGGGHVDIDTSLVVDGNVGIGTDSPATYYSGADNLVVYQASGEAGITVATATDTTGALYFADGTSGNEQYRGGIAYTHSTDKLSLVSGGSNKMIIDSSGNVGIGTDSPASKLVVRTSTDHNFEVEETGGELRLSALNNARSANIGLQFAASEFNFITGNVGIGQTSIPSTVLLDLKEPDAGSDLIIGLTAGTGARAQIRSEAQSDNTTAELSFHTVTGSSTSEAMRIDSSGNVTIGTGIIKPSIGGDIAITQGAIGLRINDAASAISPTTATANNDNAVDLGVSNIRFRNLYMGGTGTFGGSIKASSSAYVQLEADQTDSAAVRMGVSSASLEGFVMCNNEGAGHISGNTILKMLTYSTGGALIESARFTTNGASIKTTLNAHTLQVGGDIGINTSVNVRLRFYRSGYFKAGIQVPDTDGQMIDSSGVDDLAIRSQNNMLFATGGNIERMRIDSLGQTKFLNRVEIQAADTGTNPSAGTSARLIIDNNSNTNGCIAVMDFRNYSTFVTARIGAQFQDADDKNTDLYFMTRENGGTLDERMRITSVGDVLIGTTSKGTTGAYFESASSNRMVLNLGTSTTSASNVAGFRNPNGLVGTIRTSGTSTSYITSSDYRLKENVVEMTGALDRVSQLKPSRFNFIADADTTVDGFLAHEVQDIVPEAISGEKDAVDEEGNPEYQGIDQSKLVPLLVGAIQELKAEIELLKTKINN